MYRPLYEEYQKGLKLYNAVDFDAEATFPSNHVLRGTKVMAGHGICRVLAVGEATTITVTAIMTEKGYESLEDFRGKLRYID